MSDLYCTDPAHLITSDKDVDDLYRDLSVVGDGVDRVSIDGGFGHVLRGASGGSGLPHAVFNVNNVPSVYIAVCIAVCIAVYNAGEAGTSEEGLTTSRMNFRCVVPVLVNITPLGLISSKTLRNLSAVVLTRFF